VDLDLDLRIGDLDLDLAVAGLVTSLKSRAYRKRACTIHCQKCTCASGVKKVGSERKLKFSKRKLQTAYEEEASAQNFNLAPNCLQNGEFPSENFAF